MKKLLYILCAAALAAGCSDDDASSYYLDELVIDTANCLAEGSYVQGVEANDLCRIKIPYENARGGTARISAPETNGLRIDAQEVTLVSGAGEATVAVKGSKPRSCNSTSNTGPRPIFRASKSPCWRMWTRRGRSNSRSTARRSRV